MKILKIQYKIRTQKMTFRNKNTNLDKIMKIPSTISQGLSKFRLPYNFNLRYNIMSGDSSLKFQFDPNGGLRDMIDTVKVDNIFYIKKQKKNIIWPEQNETRRFLLEFSWNLWNWPRFQAR
jgi:hypothetical protein